MSINKYTADLPNAMKQRSDNHWYIGSTNYLTLDFLLTYMPMLSYFWRFHVFIVLNTYILKTRIVRSVKGLLCLQIRRQNTYETFTFYQTCISLCTQTQTNLGLHDAFSKGSIVNIQNSFNEKAVAHGPHRFPERYSRPRAFRFRAPSWQTAEVL